MRKTIYILLGILLLTGALQASAQVVESATGRRLELKAGGMASAAQPDYAGGPTAENSPYHLIGVGAYVDFRLKRWVQLEGEGRMMTFNKYQNVSENNYLVGLREPIHTFHRLTPYGKVLVGFSSGSFLTGRASTYAFGGGVDYQLSNRFTLRACDIEMQHWSVNPTIKPYVGSIGLSYKIF
jgi:hypothetical protein